jgi:class 3 adenylate cyclase
MWRPGGHIRRLAGFPSSATGARPGAGLRYRTAVGAGRAAAEDALAASPANAAAEAERRQLTVMFCDLIGSTALSVRFDPEELREEIRAYQNTVSGVVARYDGFVAKFMGDGVLVYFGYPQAHEDDAERAVRAGLEISSGGHEPGDPWNGAARRPHRHRHRACRRRRLGR